jgi:ABC-type polar amino acid transport system ATPase subunit
MAPQQDDDIPPGILDAFRRGRVFNDERRSGEERREEDSDMFRVKWSMVFQVIGWVLGLFVVYNAMTSRLTALETNRANDTQRIERIESKIDRLLEQQRK